MVSLDRKGKGLEALMDSLAALIAAGVDFDSRTLLDKLQPAEASTRQTLSFAAHREPIHDLPLPTRAPAPPESSMQTMPKAPKLRPITGDVFNPAPAVLPPVATPTLRLPGIVLCTTQLWSCSLAQA